MINYSCNLTIIFLGSVLSSSDNVFLSVHWALNLLQSTKYLIFLSLMIKIALIE